MLRMTQAALQLGATRGGGMLIGRSSRQSEGGNADVDQQTKSQEVAIQRALQRFRERPSWPSIANALHHAGVEQADDTMPWQDMALVRAAWRAFARWAAFRAEM